MYDKYDVMFSEVHFTINQKGEVFAFKVTFYKDAALDQLVAKAKEDPALNNDSSLLILPLKSLQKAGLTGSVASAQYHLVRKVITKDSLARTYANYIDVYSGDTVWQKKLTLDFEAKIKMKVNTFDKYN